MTYVQPGPRADLRWIAVDLDGTLAEPVWTPENPTLEIGLPIDKNARKVWGLHASGYKIVIHTSRGWEHYEAIEGWMNYWGIPFDKIVCGKLLALRYIDDRAVNADEESWLP